MTIPRTQVTEIYCLKCRKFTPNTEIRTTKAGERKIQKTECVECGKKKNRFVKRDVNENAYGIVDNINDSKN